MKRLAFTLLFLVSLNLNASPEYCEAGAEHVLPICQDQVAMINDAVEDSIANNTKLFVMAGATWCSWTRSFIQAMQEPSVVPANANYIHIGVSHRSNGERVEVQSGIDAIQSLIDRVGSGQTYEELVMGFPSVMIFDPSQPNQLLRLENGPMGTETGYHAEMIRAEFQRLAEQ